jgi:SAM-dependent methyltransferase
MNAPIPDLAALKTRLKGVWSAGDFGQIARSYEAGAAEFVADLDIARGTRVLDVACGTGNLAIPAARAGATVTGVDIAPNLVQQARARAVAEGVRAQFDEGDAEELPYKEGSFDLVLSMFGAMFGPRPERVAAELIRVCRPGGRIVLANWVPTGFIGQIFKTTGAHVPPPAGMPSPLAWGDEATAKSRLKDGIADIRCKRRAMTFAFPFAPPEVVEYWRQYYGPTQKAFAALDEKGQGALRRDLEALWTAHNRATDGSTRVESEYLEVAATRAQG